MFAIFSNGKSEIMYQTRASAELDDSDAVSGVGNSIIYVEVASIEEILQTALQHPIVKPKHITPYGAKEVYIRDPAGNVIGFAELTEGS
ncbi:MAG: VOC family protein [Pseudomonadota bacterium]